MVPALEQAWDPPLEQKQVIVLNLTNKKFACKGMEPKAMASSSMLGTSLLAATALAAASFWYSKHQASLKNTLNEHTSDLRDLRMDVQGLREELAVSSSATNSRLDRFAHSQEAWTRHFSVLLASRHAQNGDGSNVISFD